MKPQFPVSLSIQLFGNVSSGRCGVFQEPSSTIPKGSGCLLPSHIACSSSCGVSGCDIQHPTQAIIHFCPFSGHGSSYYNSVSWCRAQDLIHCREPKQLSIVLQVGREDAHEVFWKRIQSPMTHVCDRSEGNYGGIMRQYPIELTKHGLDKI